jgi:hypothetical protein
MQDSETVQKERRLSMVEKKFFRIDQRPDHILVSLSFALGEFLLVLSFACDFFAR